MNDQRVGAAIRALRRRKFWRQVDLAAAAAVPQSTPSEIERGHLDEVPLRTLRRLCSALDARGDIELFWRGGLLDRLLDRRHADLVERMVRELRAAAWESRTEVTYSIYGERGSVDVIGIRPQQRVALIGEIKSDITSFEATNRAFDPKIRLASNIVREQFGFSPEVVGAILVLPDASTARRRIAEHRATFDARYPARTVAVRRWLARPTEPIRGILFLPAIARGDPRDRIASPAHILRSHPRSTPNREPPAIVSSDL